MTGFRDPYCPTTGKRIYLTRGEARLAKRAMVLSGRKSGSLDAYVCRKCGGWHLGRK